MTKVIIVGEVYHADLRPDQGLPGPGGGPVDPGYSPPWARPGAGGPVDPGYSPPWARPGRPVYPDQGLPGNQPYPDQGLPGSQPHPDQGLPGQQPGIWGPNDPRPTPPIYLGPEVPAPEPVPPITWRAAWTARTGWITVGIPTGETPTPS